MKGPVLLAARTVTHTSSAGFCDATELLYPNELYYILTSRPCDTFGIMSRRRRIYSYIVWVSGSTSEHYGHFFCNRNSFCQLKKKIHWRRKTFSEISCVFLECRKAQVLAEGIFKSQQQKSHCSNEKIHSSRQRTLFL